MKLGYFRIELDKEETALFLSLYPREKNPDPKSPNQILDAQICKAVSDMHLESARKVTHIELQDNEGNRLAKIIKGLKL